MTLDKEDEGMMSQSEGRFYVASKRCSVRAARLLTLHGDLLPGHHRPNSTRHSDRSKRDSQRLFISALLGGDCGHDGYILLMGKSAPYDVCAHVT